MLLLAVKNKITNENKLKVSFGYHKYGIRWRFKFSYKKYWMNKIWVLSFWRIFINLDFRKNWLEDMRI